MCCSIESEGFGGREKGKGGCSSTWSVAAAEIKSRRCDFKKKLKTRSDDFDCPTMSGREEGSVPGVELREGKKLKN